MPDAPTPPPARKRLRFHLSTALVWMFVLAVCLGLNVIPRGPYVVTETETMAFGMVGHKRTTWTYEYELGRFRGFPFALVQAGETWREPGVQGAGSPQAPPHPYSLKWSMNEYMLLFAAADLLLPLLCAFAAGRLAERVRRGRARTSVQA
ncbi:MAG: hypothetical protein L6R28_08705 [Planctomycetes bacterium]|nr:hypothetical protein [Planctomycetota bacterium]